MLVKWCFQIDYPWVGINTPLPPPLQSRHECYLSFDANHAPQINQFTHDIVNDTPSTLYLQSPKWGRDVSKASLNSPISSTKMVKMIYNHDSLTIEHYDGVFDLYFSESSESVLESGIDTIHDIEISSRITMPIDESFKTQIVVILKNIKDIALHYPERFK